MVLNESLKILTPFLLSDNNYKSHESVQKQLVKMSDLLYVRQRSTVPIIQYFAVKRHQGCIRKNREIIKLVRLQTLTTTKFYLNMLVSELADSTSYIYEYMFNKKPFKIWQTSFYNFILYLV